MIPIVEVDVSKIVIHIVPDAKIVQEHVRVKHTVVDVLDVEFKVDVHQHVSMIVIRTVSVGVVVLFVVLTLRVHVKQTVE